MRRPVLVGHSRGASVVAAYVDEYPAEVAGAVSVGGDLWGEPDPAAYGVYRPGAWPAVGSLIVDVGYAPATRFDDHRLLRAGLDHAFAPEGPAPTLRCGVARGELLKIVYDLERVLAGEPDDNQLDVWAVAFRRGTLVGEEDVTWEEVGTATLYGMDPYRNSLVAESPFDVADAYSADTAYYYEHVFDASGDLLADVRGEFEWVEGRALFLHDVQVPQSLRRRGYGSLLAADAILTLAPRGTAVFAHPGPADIESEDPADLRRLQSETENTRFLAALGFAPFRDRLWTLDLSAGDGAEMLARTRRAVTGG